MGKYRNVCIVTGTRAEYGLLTSLLAAVRDSDTLTLQLVVTGMHLLEQFGHTVDDIRRDGWDIDCEIPMYTGSDRREDLSGALATIIRNFGSYLARSQSDVVVVLGDRVEVLGAAMAALTAGVPIAHIHGGEIAPGDMDDRIRYAVSSIADIHLVASLESKRRLIRYGHDARRMFQVGAIGLDHIYALKRRWRGTTKRRARAGFGFDGEDETLVVAHHPCALGAEDEYRQMSTILNAVADRGGIIIGPNSDPGHSGILRAIDEFITTNNRWVFHKSLPREQYLKAIWACDALVGNSSSGILEANALGTAVVNIGPRQTGRQRNGNAILDVDGDTDAIRAATSRATARTRARKVRSSQAFGNGRSGQKIAEILAESQLLTGP